MPCQYSLGFLHFQRARLSMLGLTHQNTTLKLLMQRAQKLNLSKKIQTCASQSCRLCKTMAMAVLCLVTQSCSTLCNPMDCSPPGSSVHGILQARILECIACPPPGDLLNPGANPGLPHCRWILYCLSYQGSPMATAAKNKGPSFHEPANLTEVVH